MKKISVILILVIAIVSLFGTAYCFADETTELINISDSVSLDIDEILSLYSEEYLSVNENEETVVVVEYNDEDSHSLSADLHLLGVDATTRYTYSYIFNGESISIKLKDISSLTQLSYIKSVSLSNTYYTEEVSESSYEFVSEDATTTGEFKNTTAYQGDGMVVAVIDACFDISHVAFDSITSTDLALSLSDVKDVLYNLNAYELSGETVQNVYKSEKIPFAYDYGESDSDVYSSITFHGTHVAGITAGNCSSFTGVVPNAQLVLMKMADEEGAMATDTIAAAIEDAIKLGVDVINISLGAQGGFSATDMAVYKATEAAENAGISVVCAAGNQGTSADESRSGTDLAESEYVDNAAVDSPGSFESTVSIANAEETRYFVLNKGTSSETKVQYGMFIDSDYSAVYDFTEMCLEYMSTNGITDSLPYIVLSKDDKIDLGSGTDSEGVDISGKIVVVDFDVDTARVDDIFDGGAIGIIFVNSASKVSRVKTSGEPIIPVCLVSKEGGEALIAAATSKEGVIYVDRNYVKVTIASSSSKGVTSELELGVDVTGYGSNIYSSSLNQSYTIATGTSMASPNVAGVFTVVRQYIKANALLFGVDSNDNVKIAEIATKLIMSNTTLLTDLNDVLISPRSQGAGLANIEKAITSFTYISCEDETKTKIELGDNIKDTITLSFKIENYDSSAKDYELSVALLTELLQDNYLSGYEKELSFTIDNVQNITISGNKYLVHVDANSTLQVSLTLTISEESIEYLNQFENGIYLEGYIILDDSGNTMSCPFIGFYGDWNSQDVLDLTIYEESEDNKAYLRASTVYGNYADSYYLPLGKYIYSISDKYDGEEPTAQEEFAALSIYSSAMYAIGYFQLGLLRNAAYIEMQLINTQTGEVTTLNYYTYTTKTKYDYNYASIIGAEGNASISPYTLNLYNNEQYELVLNA
ncbi:MAG: S8 family serine peptidase [Clostridia bacterium]|nr:S8 family serine peptidase [Clostridia bacterium]